jgi:hypothetical protein
MKPIVLLYVSALLCLPAGAATFTVVNTADSGPGSLRQTLLDAAASSGKDTIAFNIPGSSQPTISLSAPLPNLAGDILDGSTQPGGTGIRLLLTLLPNNTSGAVLTFTGTAAECVGIGFQDESQSGGRPTTLRLDGSGQHKVRACSFTQSQTSQINAPIHVISPANLIGGGTGQRNKFSGARGILIEGTVTNPAGGNILRGNEFSGPPRSFGPTTYAVQVQGQTPDTIIESDEASGAINTFDSLRAAVSVIDSDRFVFRRNRFGHTTGNATAATGGLSTIVTISDCPNALVELNSFQRSGRAAIAISNCPGGRVVNNSFQNVYDGTWQPAPTHPGIKISGTGNADLLISGNVMGGMEPGILVSHEGTSAPLTGIRIEGNTLGLRSAFTISDTTPLVPPAAEVAPCTVGIYMEGWVEGVSPGGLDMDPTKANTIVGQYGGIVLSFPLTGGNPNTPQAVRCPNNRIWVTDPSYQSRIVALSTPDHPLGWLAESLPVRAYSPVIDSLDGDSGANTLQNPPVLQTATGAQVTGILDSSPSASFSIHLYASPQASGQQRGIPVFISTVSVTTDASGRAAWTIPVSGLGGSLFYALATNAAGATGPVSNFLTSPAPTLTISIAQGQNLPEGATVTVTATRNGDLNATSVFELGGAWDIQAGPTPAIPADLSSTVQITLPPGEATKEVNFTIIDDSFAERPEQFTFKAVPVSGLASPTVYAEGWIEILASDLPRVTLGDASVSEGQAGSRIVTLPVTLDQPMLFPRLFFRIKGGTAMGGVDYTSAPTNLEGWIIATMSSDTAGVVSVTLLGDTIYEQAETVEIEFVEGSGGPIPLVDTSNPDTGTLTILNDDLPRVRIVPAETGVAEGDSGSTEVTFTVQSLDSPTEEVRVPWTTVAETASEGADFTPTSGTAVLPPGTASATITVPVRGDTIVDRWPDEAETFRVDISDSLTALTIPAETSARVQILDDDLRTISVPDASRVEGNSGTSQLTFTARIPSATGSPLSFDWSTTAETADSSDFTGGSGTVTIEPGQTEATIALTVRGDTLHENAENFTIELTNAINSPLARSQAVGTILNDDTAPTLTIENTAVTEGVDDVDFFAWFRVRLSAASGAPVNFQCATADGTALQNLDYMPYSNNHTIPAGERTLWIAVPVLGDSEQEREETFQLHIPGASGATLPSTGITGTATLRETAITRFFPMPGAPQIYAISFWTGRGQAYLIEQSSSLGDNLDWVPVSGIIPGSGAEVTQLQFSAAERAYFRVRVTAVPPG